MIWYILYSVGILVCIVAYKVARDQRKLYVKVLEEDGRLIAQAFGPLCKCGHRQSMHMTQAISKTHNRTWCWHSKCKCGCFRKQSAATPTVPA